MKNAKTTDEYILKQSYWQNELLELRQIMRSSGLKETIKWGIPVYTHNDKNIAGMAAFKNYVAIWFYQGATLKDEKKKLVNAQEGITKALRQWRFKSPEDIEPELIRQYISEAIENEIKGNIIEPSAKSKIEIPVEITLLFHENKELKENFNKLTPFKQREFIEFISEAKRPETRKKRVDKIIPILAKGLGLNDKYR